MFKLAITLVVIITLAGTSEAQELDCNSDDLPDMPESILKQ